MRRNSQRMRRDHERQRAMTTNADLVRGDRREKVVALELVRKRARLEVAIVFDQLPHRFRRLHLATDANLAQHRPCFQANLPVQHRRVFEGFEVFPPHVVVEFTREEERVDGDLHVQPQEALVRGLDHEVPRPISDDLERNLRLALELQDPLMWCDRCDRVKPARLGAQKKRTPKRLVTCSRCPTDRHAGFGLGIDLHGILAAWNANHLVL